MLRSKPLAQDLVEFAAEQQRSFDALTPPEVRKAVGHFGTSSTIARFMAGLIGSFQTPSLRILDPGAGVGTLSAAVCDRVMHAEVVEQISIEAWENDPALIPLLRKTMLNCQRQLRACGRDLKFSIRNEDFILGNAQQSLFDRGPLPAFDVAILNPPYFKLRIESPQATAMKHLIHGQPNIYALFMGVAADLLVPGGEMVAITPRSYFNGLYFKRFRKWFFDRLTVRQIHLFESRSEAFKDDAVLQENVIIHAARDATPADVVLSTSTGRDLTHVASSVVPYDKVIDNRHGDHLVRVTTSPLEHNIREVVESLPCRFNTAGYEISTGPVVTFRSTEFLRHDRASDTAPLLWMHNVRPLILRFPEKCSKPTHIAVSKASRNLLLPAKRYILLKRFTAKEEKRRLVAGIMCPEDSYSEFVGLENHLNYIYRPSAELSASDALGLATYFNTALVDRYFRATSGSTQVNASEMRVLPIPSQASLTEIGLAMEAQSSPTYEMVERIVGMALCLPAALIEQLVEVAQ